MSCAITPHDVMKTDSSCTDIESFKDATKEEQTLKIFRSVPPHRQTLVLCLVFRHH